MTRLFVNGLTVIDFSYLHAERGLLGESWLVDVELSGSLDHQGMVLDFGDVKKQVKRLIDLEFDHKLIVPTGFSGTRVHSRDHRLEVDFTTGDGQRLRHSAPASATCLLEAETVSEEGLARAIEAALRPVLPDNVERVGIRLRPENIDGAFYHYSHGLKHHAGNCQRIAHGHRSRIEIRRNGERDPALEKDWAERWRDSYIGTRADLLETVDEDGQQSCRFRYTASQGLFDLSLPAQRCRLIEMDSTVENLAQHIADTLAAEHPGEHFLVRAFEGVEKGAIGEA